VGVGRSRSEPVRSARKCLLQPVIQGRSGPYRFSPYRSVTPEVAGSSPVAPAKVPANRHVVLSGQTPDSGRPHRLFSTKARNTRKRRETRLRATVFKPFLPASTPFATPGRRHTKWPEVKERGSAAVRAHVAGSSNTCRGRSGRTTFPTMRGPSPSAPCLPTPLARRPSCGSSRASSPEVRRGRLRVACLRCRFGRGRRGARSRSP
jgi:hypothetical protein